MVKELGTSTKTIEIRIANVDKHSVDFYLSRPSRVLVLVALLVLVEVALALPAFYGAEGIYAEYYYLLLDRCSHLC